MALKCVILTIVRGVRNVGAVRPRSVPECNLLHSSYCGVVVSYDDVVVGTRGVEPRLKTSVLSHEMR